VMPDPADKFSRLAALKPARGTPLTILQRVDA